MPKHRLFATRMIVKAYRTFEQGRGNEKLKENQHHNDLSLLTIYHMWLVLQCLPVVLPIVIFFTVHYRLVKDSPLFYENVRKSFKSFQRYVMLCYVIKLKKVDLPPNLPLVL